MVQLHSSAVSFRSHNRAHLETYKVQMKRVVVRQQFQPIGRINSARMFRWIGGPFQDHRLDHLFLVLRSLLKMRAAQIGIAYLSRGENVQPHSNQRHSTWPPATDHVDRARDSAGRNGCRAVV